MTDDEIEKLAVEHEAFGFGMIDQRGFTTHGFDPDGLSRFARALLASATQQHEGLRKAAQDVMQCIQIQHRPPVRDELERGRMVLVRLHALADLHDALHHHGTASTGAASSPISTDSTPTVDAALSVAGDKT